MKETDVNFFFGGILAVVFIFSACAEPPVAEEHPCERSRTCNYVAQTGEANCIEGHEWEDPNDAENYNCVKIICAEGETLIDDQCVVACGENEELVNGQCECENGFRLFDSPTEGKKCVISFLLSCCECLESETQYNSTDSCLSVSMDTCVNTLNWATQCHCWNKCAHSCLSIPDVCEPCPEGQYRNNETDECISCPARSHWNGSACVCDSGYTPHGDYCLMLDFFHCGNEDDCGRCNGGNPVSETTGAIGTGTCAGQDGICCHADYPFGCVGSEYRCHSSRETCPDNFQVDPIPCD